MNIAEDNDGKFARDGVSILHRKGCGQLKKDKTKLGAFSGIRKAKKLTVYC